jgi:hypothetical protein
MQAKVDKKLRSIHPLFSLEILILATIAAHVGVWWYVGVMRTCLFAFCWYIPVVVSLSDLLAGTHPLKLPGRFARNLKESTFKGSALELLNLSDRFVNGGYACFLVLAGRWIYGGFKAGRIAAAAKAAAAAAPRASEAVKGAGRALLDRAAKEK